MTKKSEIIIEKFAQGITVRWSSLSGNEVPSKALAVSGTECGVIGREIWKEVFEIFQDAPADKVRVKIECEGL